MKKDNNVIQTGGRFRLGVPLGALLLSFLPAGTSSAQNCAGESCSAAYVIDNMPAIQPSGGIFKFQAKISQGTLPVPDVNFPRVYVNLIDGGQTVGTEIFNNVQVRNSILNLRIGAGLSDLKTKIAENSDLAFQVCLNNLDNCLKPVELSSVPYSVKSEYALKTEMAQRAQVAAQCHYTHRATADADLFTSPTGSIGYYDFQSPTAGAAVGGLGVTVNEGEGFIQWVPTDDANNKRLNVCARDAGGNLIDLETLNLHAASVVVSGSLLTKGNIAADGGLDVTGQAFLRGGGTWDGGAITLNTGVNTLELVGDSLHLGGASSSTVVDGNVTFNGAVSFVGGTNDPGLMITGANVVDDTLTSSHIEDGTITADDLAFAGADIITPGSIAGTHIGGEQIDSTHIAPDSLDSGDIDQNAIGNSELADGAVNSANIRNWAVDSIHISGSTYTLDVPTSSASNLTSADMCLLLSMRVYSSTGYCTSAPEGTSTRYRASNAECTWRCF